MTSTGQVVDESAMMPPAPGTPARSSSVLHVTAVALLLLGGLLPTHALAEALAGSGATPQHIAQIVTGVILFKAALVLHGLILAAAPYLLIVRPDVRGLAPRATALAAEPWTRAETAAAAFIVVLGAALRIPSLGNGLWFDEIQTFVEYARIPLAQIVSTFDSQNQHLLYSILARVSIVLFGGEAWALRLPAVCFGVASLWAVIWFGERITARREALLAALILAVSYHHVWFSQNARGYTGLLFFTLVGSGCFLLLLDDPAHHTWRRVVVYGVSMSLAHMIHVTAVFATAAHALVLLSLIVLRRKDLAHRAWHAPLAGLVLAGTLSFLLYALVLPQFMATLLVQADAASPTVWKDPSWMLSEGLRVLSAGIPGGLFAVAIALLIMGTGVVSYWRRSPVATVIMLLPPIVTGGAVVLLSHNLWPRFFFFSAGFAVLIAVRGGFAIVQSVLPRNYAGSVAVVGAMAVAALSLITVPSAWRPKQDYGAAKTFVETNRSPADAVATTDMSAYVYSRYYRLPWTELHSAGDLTALEAGHPRTWVIVTFPVRLERGEPVLWKRLTGAYRTAARYPATVGGGDVYVMVSP